MTDPILDHRVVSERYFFPRRTPPAEPLWVKSGSEMLACYTWSPHPGAPTLVHFHGNGEVVADYVPDFTELLAASGLNVFFVEYRGYGGSTGTPTLVAMLDDVDAVFETVGCPPEAMVVYGRSVGSIYAIELAHRHPEVGRLVIESGIADPLERVLMRVSPEELGCTRAAMEAEAKRHLDHEAKLREYANPLLVMHARDDHLVDVSNAERLARWAGGQATLRIFELGDHNTILALNEAAMIEAVRRFAKGE